MRNLFEKVNHPLSLDNIKKDIEIQKINFLMVNIFQDEIEIVTVRHSSRPMGDTRLPFE